MLTDNVTSSRETNSGVRGVWVYEIGTSPYFTNVAPGEVPDLPTEATPQGAPEGYDVDVDAVRIVHTDGQQVEYPPFEPEGGQIEVHPVQYQPHRPENPEVVVVVDDTDINVDGTVIPHKKYILFFCCFKSLKNTVFFSFPFPSVFIQPGDMCKQQEEVFPVCRLQGLRQWVLLPLQAWLLWKWD